MSHSRKPKNVLKHLFTPSGELKNPECAEESKLLPSPPVSPRSDTSETNLSTPVRATPELSDSLHDRCLTAHAADNDPAYATWISTQPAPSGFDNAHEWWDMYYSIWCAHPADAVDFTLLARQAKDFYPKVENEVIPSLNQTPPQVQIQRDPTVFLGPVTSQAAQYDAAPPNNNGIATIITKPTSFVPRTDFMPGTPVMPISVQADSHGTEIPYDTAYDTSNDYHVDGPVSPRSPVFNIFDAEIKADPSTRGVREWFKRNKQTIGRYGYEVIVFLLSCIAFLPGLIITSICMIFGLVTIPIGLGALTGLALLQFGRQINSWLGEVPSRIFEGLCDITFVPLIYAAYAGYHRLRGNDYLSFREVKTAIGFNLKAIFVVFIVVSLIGFLLILRYMRKEQTLVTKEAANQKTEREKRIYDYGDSVKTVFNGLIALLIPTFLVVFGFKHGTAVYNGLHSLSKGVTDLSTFLDWGVKVAKSPTDTTLRQQIEKEGMAHGKIVATADLQNFDSLDHLVLRKICPADNTFAPFYIVFVSNDFAMSDSVHLLLAGHYIPELTDQDLVTFQLADSKTAKGKYLSIGAVTDIIRACARFKLLPVAEQRSVIMAFPKDGKHAHLDAYAAHQEESSRRNVDKYAAQLYVLRKFDPKCALDNNYIMAFPREKVDELLVKVKDLKKHYSNYSDLGKQIELLYPGLGCFKKSDDKNWGSEKSFEKYCYVDIWEMYEILNGLPVGEAWYDIENWTDSRIYYILSRAIEHVKDNAWIYGILTVLLVALGIRFALNVETNYVPVYLEAKQLNNTALVSDLESKMTARQLHDAKVAHAKVAYEDRNRIFVEALRTKFTAEGNHVVELSKKKVPEGKGGKKWKGRAKADISGFSTNERRMFVLENYEWDHKLSQEDAEYLWNRRGDLLDDLAVEYAGDADTEKMNSMQSYHDAQRDNEEQDRRRQQNLHDEVDNGGHITGQSDMNYYDTNTHSRDRNQVQQQTMKAPRPTTIKRKETSEKDWYIINFKSEPKPIELKQLKNILVTHGTNLCFHEPTVRFLFEYDTDPAGLIKIQSALQKVCQMVILRTNRSISEVIEFVVDDKTIVEPRMIAPVGVNIIEKPIPKTAVPEEPFTLNYKCLNADHDTVVKTKEFWDNSQSIMQELTRLLCTIGNEDDTEQYMHGVRTQQLISLPSHAIHRKMPEDKMTFCFQKGVPTTFMAKEVSIEKKYYDLGVLPITPTMAASKIQFKLPAKDVFDAYLVGFYVDGKTIDRSTMVLYRTVVSKARDADNRMVLRYDAPTSPGSCGSVLITCDERTVCGMHVERLEEVDGKFMTTLKTGQPLDKSMFQNNTWAPNFCL